MSAICDIDSPFESLIHTNAVPSDTDCDRIRALLHRAQKQVEDLVQKIEETRLQLDDLTRERDNANQYIDAHLALISPTRRLPQDIIRAIFIACMPTTRNAVISPEDPPLLLCQICSAWRQLALSTPQLWASLHIVVPSTPKNHRLTQTVASWLSRSGILPLSISLVISTSYSMFGATDIDQDLAKLLSLLAGMANRWQRVRMTPPAFGSFLPLAHLSAADFPLLKSISVGASLFGSDLSAEPSPWQSLPFLTAPNLRSVSISSGYDFGNLRVPWTQLSHLSISGTPYMWPRPFNIHDAVTILQQCAELWTCEFHLAETSDPSLPLTPVSLPHLWHLDLVDDMGDLEADRLFRNFTLPNLCSLKYSVPRQWFHTPRYMFLSTIERLSLDVAGLESAHLIKGLHLLPLLTDLELVREPTLAPAPESAIGLPDPDFLTHLIPDSTPQLCPNLRRLHLSNFRALTDETLLAFIRARTESDSHPHAQGRLERVVVRLAREKTFDVAAALHEVVANGLQLVLEYSSPLMFSEYSPWENAEEEEPDALLMQ
ncbi:F-box domain-containing protein [Mycena venus]|uniref:F-box domain-containing protein n=1 Tax=Mycena venus TaxID=2733690 RepID=A0A8H6XHE5_9AGAR|nr:F-box domain-containing protein [Mycena venus]